MLDGLNAHQVAIMQQKTVWRFAIGPVLTEFVSLSRTCQLALGHSVPQEAPPILKRQVVCKAPLLRYADFANAPRSCPILILQRISLAGVVLSKTSFLLVKNSHKGQSHSGPFNRPLHMIRRKSEAQ